MHGGEDDELTGAIPVHDHALDDALPGLAVLLPLLILLAYVLATRFPEEPPRLTEMVEITGRGQDERLVLPVQDFLYAEAQQNYVAIFIRGGEGVEERFFRMPLTDLEDQIPGSARIHRSYLVHPSRVREVVGNARRREAVLEGVERRLPVSPSLDMERVLGEPS